MPKRTGTGPGTGPRIEPSIPRGPVPIAVATVPAATPVATQAPVVAGATSGPGQTPAPAPAPAPVGTGAGTGAGTATPVPAQASLPTEIELSPSVKNLFKGRNAFLPNIKETIAASDKENAVWLVSDGAIAGLIKGMKAGAVIGAGLGSALPGVGTLAGLAAGAAAGAVAGSFGGAGVGGDVTGYYSKRIKELVDTREELKEEVDKAAPGSKDRTKAEMLLAENEFEIVKFKNLKRKGKVTGGDYHEKRLDGLTKRAAYLRTFELGDPFRVKTLHEVEQEERKEKIVINNKRIKKLTADLARVDDNPDYNDEEKKDAKIAIYKKLKDCYKAREDAFTEFCSIAEVRLDDFRKKEKRKNFEQMNEDLQFLIDNPNDTSALRDFEERRRLYNDDCENLNISAGLGALYGKDNRVPVEVSEEEFKCSRYETWLINKMVAEYDKEVKQRNDAQPSGAQLEVNFDKLSADEAYIYAKKWLREKSNDPVILEEYAKLGDKVEPKTIQEFKGSVVEFKTTKGKISQRYGSNKKIFFSIENSPNMVLSVPNFKGGEDVIEFKDGKLVDMHISDPKTTRLDMGSLIKLAKKQENIPYSRTTAIIPRAIRRLGKSSSQGPTP